MGIAERVAEAKKQRMDEQVAAARFVRNMVFLGVGVVILFLVLILGWPFRVIDAGHVGVVMRWGAVQPTPLEEGLRIVTPFADSVEEMSTQVQKYEVEASAASKDLQDVHSVVAVNFFIDPKGAAWVWQNLRDEYDTRIIAPAVQEAVKAATAQFTAEDLIRNRETVRDQIKQHLTEKLGESRIIVKEVAIVNFQFSDNFTGAIEAKQVAEQTAQKAKNDLERVKFEAQQSIENAKAEAEMLRLQKEQITPMMLELEAIKKWNGTLPEIMVAGDKGAIPFLNLDKLKR